MVDNKLLKPITRSLPSRRLKLPKGKFHFSFSTLNGNAPTEDASGDYACESWYAAQVKAKSMLEGNPSADLCLIRDSEGNEAIVGSY